MPRKKAPVLRARVKSERFQELRKLPFFDEIHEKVIKGVSSPKIADFIREDRAALLEVDRAKLINLLSAYRKSLSPAELLMGTAPEDVLDAKDRLQEGIDEVTEMQHLYSLQLRRVGLLIAHEKTLSMPLPTTLKEIQFAQEILLGRVKARLMLGISNDTTEGDEVETTEIMIRKVSSKVSPEAQALLAKPESRMKMLHLMALSRAFDPLLKARSGSTTLLEAEGTEVSHGGQEREG